MPPLLFLAPLSFRSVAFRQPVSRPAVSPRPPSPCLPPPRCRLPAPRHRDFIPNSGAVIDMLRTFYPFSLSLEPDLTYFSEDLMFCDTSGNQLVGHSAYRMLFFLLRAQARLLFSQVIVEVRSLFFDEAEGCVYVRWRVEGCWRGAGGGVVVDGLSVYVLDWRGLVKVHKVENLVKGRGGRKREIEWEVGREWREVGRGVPSGAGIGGYWGWEELRRRRQEGEDAEEAVRKGSAVKVH